MAEPSERWLSEEMSDARYLKKDEVPEFDTTGLLSEEDAAETYLSKTDAKETYLSKDMRDFILIDGKKQPRNGTITTSMDISSSGGALYYGNTQLTMPYTPPDGSIFVFTGYGTSGAAFIGRVGGASTASPTVQFMSHLSRTGHNVTISWRLASA